MRFTVRGKAVPQGTLVRSPHGGLYTPKTVKQWRDDIKAVALEVMGERALMEGPLAVTMTFWIRRPQSHLRKGGELTKSAPLHPTGRNSGDVDKLSRAALDAMTEVVFIDDAQVIDLTVRKRFTIDQAGVDVDVVPAF